MSAAAKLRELDAKMGAAPWCKDVVYSQVRHVVRNVDIECYTHAWDDPACFGMGKYDGPHLTLLRNALPELAAFVEASEAFNALFVIEVHPGGRCATVRHSTGFEMAARKDAYDAALSALTAKLEPGDGGKRRDG